MNLTKINCPVCGELTDTEPTLKTYDCYFAKTEPLFDYSTCGHCSSMFQPNPPKDLKPYYPDDYYSFDKFTGKENPDKKEIAIGYIEHFKLTEKTSILDFGAGNISLIYSLYKNGMDIVRAYDPFADNSEFKIDNTILKIQNELPTDRKFDFVISNHSIEHSNNAIDYIKQIGKVQVKGGKVTIGFPTVGFSTMAYRGLSPNIDAPRHIFVPSIKGLGIAVEKTGYKITEVIPSSCYFSIVCAEFYKTLKPYKDLIDWQKALPRKDSIMYQAVADYIYQMGWYDTCNIVAQKL